MSSTINLIQPTIIKFNNNENLPDTIRNKYAINLNACGMTYKSLSNVFDIPRIYIPITESILNDNSIIYDLTICVNRTVLPKDYIAGVDYYMNSSLYEYLNKNHNFKNTDAILPDYLTDNGELNTECFDELSDIEKTYTDLQYYHNKNILIDNLFTENQITNICMTFASIILEFTQISDELSIATRNQVYRRVLEFFANGGTDCALQNLELILNQNVTITNTVSNMLNSCGSCASSSSTSNDESCVNTYIDSMHTLFKNMLSDIDFYKQWFMIELPDAEIPNSVMISYIKELLLAYEEAYSGAKVVKANDCGCPELRYTGCSDYSAFDNFITLLDYIIDSTLDKNQNKVKLYGSMFADMLLSICMK